MSHAEDIKSYREIVVVALPVLQDLLCNFVIEHVTTGLEIEEEESGDRVVVKFYLPEEVDGDFDNSLQEFLEQISMEFGVERPEVSENIVVNRAWEEEYRKSVQPTQIGREIIVRPPWDKTTSDHAYQIYIEPKMAFGTGTHESTRSSLLAIHEHFEEGMRFLDVGCGSGILSILADKLGASFIKAVDYDEVAVENCRENLALNSVEAKSEVFLGTIEVCRDDEPYDFVCANIIRKTILEILDDLIRLTQDGGKLLLSGLLDDDVEEITTALQERGQSDFQEYSDNEWRTIVVFKG